MSSEVKVFKWTVQVVMMIVLGITFLLAPQNGFSQSSDEAYRVDEFSVSGEVSVEVQTSGGSIKVIGSNNDKVVVEMYVRKRGKYIEPGKADLDDFQIDISQNGNMIKAIADKKSKMGWNWDDNYSISFIVYAPQETRSRLKTSGGSLSASNLTGSQELRTSGGSISAEGIQGEMVLKTSGGSISISDSQGDVEANTSGGPISVKSLVGNLDAKTSGGSITLKGIEGNVEAKTSGGSINAEIIAPADFIDLKTSGGSITITVPKENGYNLDLDGNRVYADLVNFSGKAERDEINGNFNGGGTTLKAKTSGGSVRLEYL